MRWQGPRNGHRFLSALLVVVTVGLTMWRRHPVLGLGPGGVKREYESYALPEAVKKRTSHVHSTPLQILVEHGVLGLAAWQWIWAALKARVSPP
jgi:O-antigen ligase